MAGLALATSACALFAPLPEPTDLDQRLAAFPTENIPFDGAVTIHWDAHQIPFIEAERDEDAAFALGMVHAHLRLGQMETVRRISQGRIAEMAGPIPFVLNLDHSLRTLGFGRGASDVLDVMPAETRSWVESFTAGLNHYLMTVERLPHDFRVMGFDRSPWTPEEVLTIGRLGGTDINWLVWFSLLEARNNGTLDQALAREQGFGSLAPSSIEATEAAASSRPGRDRALAMLNEILSNSARGSNSLALSGDRTASGLPLIANDPHLGVVQPNLWLIAGVKSPSFHVVGLMPTALPFFALGRNEDIAWGGTNMRAASSDLVDVGDLPESAFTTETYDIGVRFWFDTERASRISPYGPLLSDAPLMPFPEEARVALRWIGHQPTDEITALLAASQAANYQQFRQAFDTFGVSAQNMVYADRHGSIGLVSAAQIPQRPLERPTDIIISRQQADAYWADIATATELPYLLDPPQGFIASANNPPGEADFPIGWFFSSPDRIDRLSQLVRETTEPWDVGDLADLQTDAYSPSSVLLRDAVVARVGDRFQGTEAWDLITGWDGHFDADSRGALAFQAFYVPFAQALWAPLDRNDDWDDGDGKWRVLEVVDAADDATLIAAAETAMAAVPTVIEEHGSWGSIHRMRIQMLQGNIPVIGGRYQFIEYGVGGSQETVMKSAHDETVDAHTVNYGAQSRHISDLSDPDANYFVLLGGQDGWINSSTQLDQVDLWRAGSLIRVPLRVETVRQEAQHSMEFGVPGS